MFLTWLSRFRSRRPQWSAPRRLTVAVLACCLLFAVEAGAQSNVTGRWAPIGNSWHQMQIHVALLRGDTNYHSKIVSWWYGGEWWTGDPSNPPNVQRGSFWGWNPNSNPSNNDCSSYPLSEFTPLHLDSPGFNFFCGGHSMLTSGDLLVTGGHDNANDVGLRSSFIFRRNAPSGQQWSQQGTLAAGRWYPTNRTLADGKVITFSGTRFEQRMVVFGGTAAPQNPSSPATDDINRLGLNVLGQWDPAVTRPWQATNWPDPREGHTAVLYSPTSDMIVFGGREGGTTNLAPPATWLLSVNELADQYNYSWTQPTITGGPPLARTRHTAIMRRISGSDVRMIIYGGLDGNSQPLNDAWELSRDPQGSWHWNQLVTTGTSPSFRYGHAAVYDALNDRMVVFGGRTTGGTLADNDVYVLSCPTNTWSKLTLATKPEAREGHSWFIDPNLRAGSPFVDPDTQDQRIIWRI